MKNDVRKMTDGAMMAAIMGAVLLIDRQTAGLLQGTVLFLFPLPMVFFGTKYGWKDSWVVFAAIVLLAGILETPASMILVACESMIGMVYGCGIHDHVDTKKLVLRTVFISVLVSVLTTLVFAEFFGYDIAGEISEIKDMLSSVENGVGIDVSSSIDIEQMIKSVIVTTVVLTGVLDGVVLHLLGTVLLKRLHFPIAKSTPFLEYFPPKWTGYAGIAGMVLFYYATYSSFGNELLNLSLQGLGFCGSVYLLLYGAAAIMIVAKYYMPHAKVMPILLVVILFFAASFALEIIGFLYITTNMHRRILEGGFQK